MKDLIFKNIQRKQKTVDISELTGNDGDTAVIQSITLGERERMEKFLADGENAHRAAYIAYSLYRETDDGLERIFDESDIERIKDLPFSAGTELYIEILRINGLLDEKN